ncbi:c-type cytochrome [Candidatus Leptofilum sp.]|uniref:c-type cytochrome n=1 Tax=Candidatus Leptofilum sp. TaxID=3241576 RepID=UPI003B5B7495
MRKKLVLMVGLVLLIGVFAWPGLARAGGWATLTLSELPTEVVAERPFTIEFLLLQHGQTPLFGGDLFTQVTAVHTVSGEQITVEAQAAKNAGYYEATITFPRAGEWQWEIEAFTAVYPMPSLMVNEAAAAASDIVGGETSVAWQLVVGWTAALGTGLLFVLWARQKSRPRLVVAVLLGIVSLVSFGLYWQMPAAVQAETKNAIVPAIAPEAVGEALFVAKGCIQCHTNENVTMADNILQIGPDLSFVKRPPEYVALWLANPDDLKTGTLMPNLHLSEAEIDTLVTFLQQD